MFRSRLGRLERLLLLRWRSVAGFAQAISGYRRNEAIPSPRQCFYEPGVFRGIAQYFSKLVDSRVQVAFDVDKSVAPQVVLQFLPGDDLARARQQQPQDFKRLTAEFKLDPALADLAGLQIDFKDPETDRIRYVNCAAHLPLTLSYASLAPGARKSGEHTRLTSAAILPTMRELRADILFMNIQFAYVLRYPRSSPKVAQAPSRPRTTWAKASQSESPLRPWFCSLLSFRQHHPLRRASHAHSLISWYSTILQLPLRF